ncbi:hypothetical protein [Methylovulum psychrotolerans]|jgi:hypothetical protein|uniref:Uncharacterized protein n=1 Tax=Methylovulum psychrotolerans TaxID=1704499 RepID=A0A1Z4C059_9GAMM|nr:hypothetical protein [Methylovulum psychrotolerans]ASF46879.1 hypothetical protein CEK71_12805 [Methylovulum psychrotolerans]MBT9098916.1 hypothetical protein [Methylovulum psychrotolerans]POZ50333.1 hypothetical protein AADEFJLK_03918 [Methylovulum psychrotolerans]
MSETVKEDNSLWYIVGGCIVAMIAIVIFLRGEKSEHLKSGAVAQLQAETFANIEKRHTQNNVTEAQKAGK